MLGRLTPIELKHIMSYDVVLAALSHRHLSVRQSRNVSSGSVPEMSFAGAVIPIGDDVSSGGVTKDGPLIGQVRLDGLTAFTLSSTRSASMLRLSKYFAPILRCSSRLLLSWLRMFASSCFARLWRPRVT